MKKYLCGVAFDTELGYTDEIGFYDSVDILKEDRECWEECGIVEVEFDGPNNPGSMEDIKAYKWVVEQNMSWGKS